MVLFGWSDVNLLTNDRGGGSKGGEDNEALEGSNIVLYTPSRSRFIVLGPHRTYSIGLRSRNLEGDGERGVGWLWSVMKYKPQKTIFL